VSISFLPGLFALVRIGLFDLEDAIENVDREWLDVCGIRHLGIGHDHRRIAVDENDAEAQYRWR
jgi:hypothetical protein